MCLFYLYAKAKIEIHICSNKHETGQEAFHVYLNKFEIVVSHLFFVILCKS